MSDDLSTEDLREFDCPLCDGAFEISAEWLGQEIACPHCGGVVALPEEEAPEEETPEEETPEKTREEEPARLFERPAVEAPIIEVPAVERAAATPPELPPAKPEPLPPRKLTPEERAALRKRVNLFVACFSAVVLVVLFLVLSQWG